MLFRTPGCCLGRFFLFLLMTLVTLTLTTQTSFAAVAQQTGFYDTRYINVTDSKCTDCHGLNTADRHHATYQGSTSQCAYCHPTADGQPVINRDCKSCHYSSNHHKSGFAVNKDCAACHSPQVVSSLVEDPGVFTPPNEVLPSQCRNCHTGSETASPPIAENRDLHHDVGLDCQTCHLADLSLNIRLCEQCHLPSTLHALHQRNCAECHRKAASAEIPPAAVLPVSNALSASSGYVGDRVVITGTNFGLNQGTVKIGIASADVGVWQDQSIEITIPNLAPGNYNVAVVNSNGSSNIKVFTVLDPLEEVDSASIGIPDQPYSDFTETDCRNCHGVTVDLHHATPSSVTCSVCHQISDGQVVTRRNCLLCHTTSPHHVTQTAKAGTCTACHSSAIVAELNSAEPPTSMINEQTPIPQNCQNCHPGSATTSLHHATGLDCAMCHESADQVTMRRCEGCHTVGTLHNISPHLKTDQCVGCHAARPDQFPPLPAGIPEIRQLSVNSGGPGSILTISGNNFGDAFDDGTVYFDVYSGVVQEWTDTEIIVKVPSIEVGNYLVTARNAAGKSNGLIFTITCPGTLSGRVTNMGGWGLSGATVSVGTKVANTDSNGYYKITGLAQGIYSAQALMMGQRSETQTVTIVNNFEATADFMLGPQRNGGKQLGGLRR